jgi:hypothetical protein
LPPFCGKSARLVREPEGYRTSLYFLVGGTALSLQLGHRISDDIDLFTRSDINKDEIFDYLNKYFYKKFQINNIQNIVLQVTVNNIKVYFVKHDYNLIEGVNI